jgi:cellulose synthase/poly-beta-1,6-N-acetylglucosamine synthase-like glycosyltransferase
MTAATAFTWVLAVLSIIYAGSLCGFIVGLRRLRRNARVALEQWPSVSVVIPARNEAEVLERTLDSLLAQDYPGSWEIVVVDDRSTDNTSEVLARMAATFPLIHPLRVTEPNPPSPKKHALALGIRHATGEVIATTDADCVYDPSWLRQMVSHLASDVGVVAGLTVFDLPSEHVPVWQKIQWLDFFAQNFLAAGAAGMGIPSSCNGSNLIYRRQVYQEIAGFGRASTVISGDDVLFTQRVSRKTKWKIVFSAAPETIVRSLPVLSIRELMQQRLRWASKGLTYRTSMLAFLFGIYAYYLMLLAAPVIAVALPQFATALAVILLWKSGWDYVTVRYGTKVFGQRELLRYFAPYVLLQTVFYPFFGLAGLLVPYRWKGDWYRTARLPRRWRRGLVRVRRIVRARPPVASRS